MSDMDDEYLWSGKGTPSEDVMAIERSLAVLRWQPRVLPLPSTVQVVWRSNRQSFFPCDSTRLPIVTARGLSS